MEQNIAFPDPSLSEAAIETQTPEAPSGRPPRRFSTLPAAEKAGVLADWLEASKARDLIALDVRGKNPCMDVLLVVTASSARHARSLADGLLEQSKLNKYEYLRMEGYQAGQWVLVDLNDIVVHIFQAETRELYRLEALWSDAPRLRDTRSPAPATVESVLAD